MAVSAALIADLRIKIAEPTTETYSDHALEEKIEKYPIMDELGVEPYYFDSSTTVPTKVYNTTWIPSYDLNAAAAEIWSEKAALYAAHFDFSADGGSYQRSQRYEHLMSMSRYYASKARARAVKLFKKPDESNTTSWLGNQPEVK